MSQPFGNDAYTTDAFDFPIWVPDVETFPNFFMVGFRNLATGAVVKFSSEPGIGGSLDDLRLWFADTVRPDETLLIGFNTLGYDNTMLHQVIVKRIDDPAKLYQYSIRVIQATRQYCDSINGEISLDLLAMLGGAKSKVGSLKECGCKIGHRKIQELPYPFDQVLTHAEMVEVAEYNDNDTAITARIAVLQTPAIKGRLALSTEYNIALWNRHDAGVAEAVVGHLLNRRPYPTATTWSVSGSDLVQRFPFQHPELVALRERISGWQMQWEMVETLNGTETEKKVRGSKFSDVATVDGVIYKLGVGGLHSKDGPAIIEADEQYRLIDFDNSSYYPAIILALGLAPAHLSRPDFLAAIRGVLQHRLTAKAAGNKELSDGLKVAVNSVFGKTKSAYSWLLDPVMQVTITLAGQLILLSYVDMISGIDGAEVVSANTDGLTLRLRREVAETVIQQMHAMAERLGFNLDQVEYSKLIRKDVSNYLAIGLHGGVKSKGAYGFNREDLSRKPTERIVIDAVRQFFINGVAVEDTVRACHSIDEFADFFRCSKDYTLVDEHGVKYGGIARWVLVTDGVRLNKVRRRDGQITKQADGAVVMNDYPDTFPDTLDYERYINKAGKLIEAILNPPTVSNTTIPLNELNTAQRAQLYHNQTCPVVDLAKVQAIDLSRDREDLLGKIRGTSYDTLKAVLVRRWKAAQGDLTVAELGWLADELTAAGGASQGVYEGMVEWIGREVSPYPLPQTGAQQIARALTWAHEHVERSKVKRRMWHHSLSDSRYLSSATLAQYLKMRNDYRLACALCAASVKHDASPDPAFLLGIFEAAKAYAERPAEATVASVADEAPIAPRVDLQTVREQAALRAATLFQEAH